MPVAAVPEYLGQDFKEASPGMRFGMLLPIWAARADQEARVKAAANRRSREATELRRILDAQGMDAAIARMRQRERSFPGLWGKDDNGARKVWKHVCRLGKGDQACMDALVARVMAMRSKVPSQAVLALNAKAIAPFTTGLGNEHPLENGFSFLWPYGLPYLPGSGVKGVVRQAARELAGGRWGDPQGWSEEARYAVRDAKGKVLVDGLSMLDVLFGKETEGGEKEHFRGVLTFWDVIPRIAGDALRVEIMTPHQKHYYQDGQPPHDCGDPNPIPFLTVPPGSHFTFHVVCDEARLARVADDLAADGRWRTLLEAAFAHAFEWLGFGAKTAVGYGAMARAEDGGPAPARAAAKEQPRIEETEEVWKGAKVRYEPGAHRLTVTGLDGTQAVVQGRDKVEALLEGLSKTRRRKLQGGDTMTVRVRRRGNLAEILALEPGT